MLGVLSRFKRRAALEEASYGLYRSAIEQARAPVLYRSFAVEDSVDGRFDLLTLHVHLILRRLRAEGEDGRLLGQRLFDLMFADMDQSLRQMGVSDMRVGNRVKAMVQAFYGRVAAYDAGFEAGAPALAEALRRNVYRGAEAAPAARLADYVLACESALAAQAAAALLAGAIDFPPPEPAVPPGAGADAGAH